MNSILIDNWTIEKAISGAVENRNVELKRIMCFMLLWDDVYYLDNGYSSWWKECLDHNNEGLEFLRKLKPLPINTEYKTIVQDTYEKQYKKVEIPTIAKGALEYLVNAELNNICYAPVDERAAFIQNYKLTNNEFSRNDILKAIDAELLEYYNESAEKIRKADISLVTEAIISMIEGDSSKDVSERIEKLKRKPMIRRFRKWVDSFETDVNEGKLLLVDEYLKELKDIEHMSIDTELKPSTENIWFPMITLELHIPILKVLKTWRPQFMFPSFIYKKGKNNAKNIIFSKQSVIECISKSNINII